MGVKVQSIISEGSKGTIVDIDCHLSNNLPTIVIVGSVSKAVDESRERIRGAFATSHIILPRNRISGAVLDRTDLHCAVFNIYHNKLLTRASSPKPIQKYGYSLQRRACFKLNATMFLVSSIPI